MLVVFGEPLLATLGPFDRFEILSQLGKGAHGVVYEAFDRELSTHVALKTLRLADTVNLLRLKREFRELVSLHHPNLVELGELFEDQGRWFFSMQLVPGVDWTSYIQRVDEDVTITASRTINVLNSDEARLRSGLLQLGHGLHALHSAGKLHRDIKPSNIRVQPDGQLVLLDFGLVATPLENTAGEPGQAVGTVAYMAPEQASFGPLSAASDCYAVGILLYEALTGAVPFKGPLLEVLEAKQSQPVRIAAERAASLPADLVALCHDLCQLDPALRPSAAELVARAYGATAPSRQSPPARARTVCVGREPEMAALSSALTRARAGELAHVCLFGEPGIGKSTLLTAWAEQAQDSDPELLVLCGRCHERERVPYKALDAVIDALGERLSRMTSEQCAALVPRYAAALGHVFPVLDRLCSAEYGIAAARLPPDPIVLRAHAYGALRELFARMCERAPVVLLLDDFQWSDHESLELLAALMQAPSPPALMVVTASWSHASCSQWLQAQSGAARVDLHALPPSAACALAREVLAREGARLDSVSLDRLAANSSGHPLFIELLVRAAARGFAECYSLEQALHAELTRHSREARTVLQLTAVAGAPLSLSVLRSAAQLTASVCLKVLDELRASGLLVVHDSSETPYIAIYHLQIRDGVCSQLEQAQLRELHYALARAQSQEPTRDYEALAMHWERAACVREAALCYVQAGRQADSARAFAHAAALYERALGCASAEHDPHAWLLLQAAALANAGRSTEAAEVYVQAAERSPPAQARDALRFAARHFLSAGHSARALAIANQLLSEVGERIPSTGTSAIASALWQRARIGLRMRDLRERVDAYDQKKALACDLLFEIANPLGLLDLASSWDLHTRSLRIAIELGDTNRMARALAAEALFADDRNTADELRAMGIMARAEHLAERSGEPQLNAWVKLCSAWRHIMAGEPQLALTQADAALELYQERCNDVAWELGSVHAVSLSALTALGSFEELDRRYTAAVDAAQQRGNIASFVTLVATNRCVIDLVADRPEHCRALLEDVTRAWPAECEVQHTWVLGAQAVIDLYLGGAVAHHRIERAWPRLRRQLCFYNSRVNAVLTLVRGTAALAADGCDPVVRARIVRSCAARLLKGRPRDVRASGYFLRAQLATWQGLPEQAIRDYAQAAELWEGVGIYLGWVARQRLGELLGGDAGAAWIAQAQAWASSQRIVKVDRFFAACGPITGFD